MLFILNVIYVNVAFFTIIVFAKVTAVCCVLQMVTVCLTCIQWSANSMDRRQT